VDAGADDNGDRRKSLEANVLFAEDLGATVVRVKSRKIAEAVADVVRERHITQVIFGRSTEKGLHRLFYLSTVHRFLRNAPAVDVHIVTHGEGVSSVASI
jgi:two-component system sensor histidine kinase KdpD